MIDLVFLKFVRKLVLFSFFIVVCAFDFYGMKNRFNLGEAHPWWENNTKEQIFESSFNLGGKRKSGYGVNMYSTLWLEKSGLLNEYTYSKKILEGSSCFNNNNSYPFMENPYYGGEIGMEN